MSALTIPNIFFEGWIWFAIAIPVSIVLHFLMKKSPHPFPKVGKFCAKHTIGITKILDVLIISLILLSSLLPLSSVREVFSSLSYPEPIRKTSLQFSWTMLFTSLIFWSGQSGLLVGFISFFNSNLTKTKRIILLIVCLFPIIFTVLLLLIDNALGPWSIVQICLYSSLGSWIINTPLIFIGKNIFHVFGGILQKVKSLFGAHSV